MDVLAEYGLLAGTIATGFVAAMVAYLKIESLKWLAEKALENAYGEGLKALWAKMLGKKKAEAPAPANSSAQATSGGTALGGTFTDCTIVIHPIPSAPEAPPAPFSAAVRVELDRLPDSGDAPFGRNDDVTELDRMRRDGARIIAITAQGGEGKTALLRRWLDHLKTESWGGARRVWGWSFYNQGTDGQGSAGIFIDTALRELGFPGEIPTDERERGRALARLVSESNILLVLDGLEPLQVQIGADLGKIRDPGLDALLKTLKDQSSGLCIITSRARPKLAGIAIHDLLPLPPQAGAQLLQAMGVSGPAAELEKAADELRGHALSLTLLGRYLALAHGGAIARRDKVDLLRADAEAGNHHAERVLDSYARWLEPKYRAIMDMIGLFDRPAKPPLLAALHQPPIPGLSDALDGMADDQWQIALGFLREARLLLPPEADNAVDAHPLVRGYFRHRLENTEAARAGHDRLYQTLCTQAKDLPDTLEEMAPLLQAIRHGCAAGKHQETLDKVYLRRVMRGGEFYLSKVLGAQGDWLGCLGPFFDGSWNLPTEAVGEAAQAFLLNQAGSALQTQGQWPEAEVALRATLQRHLSAERWKEAASGTQNLANLLSFSGRLSEAIALAHRGLEYATRDARNAAWDISEATLAGLLSNAGQREAATDGFLRAESLQCKNEPKARFLYSFRGHTYCRLLLDQGKAAEVVERGNATLEISVRTNRLLDIGLDHQSLGEALAQLGQWPQAVQHLDQAITHLQRAGLVQFLAAGHVARAGLQRQLGLWEAAADDLTVAADIAEPVGIKLILTDIALERAQLALARNDRAEARRQWELGAKLVQECGYHRRDGLVAELQAKVTEPALIP